MTMRPRTRSLAAVSAVVGSALLASSCTFGPDREVTPIPPGVPPDPGEPVPETDINAPGRTADQLADWAQPIADNTGVSRTAIEAYGNAAEIMRQTLPGCGVGWTTIAGIGWVESRHGTYGGSALDGS